MRRASGAESLSRSRSANLSDGCRFGLEPGPWLQSGRACTRVGRRLLADVQAFAWSVPLGSVPNGTAFGALLPAIFRARYGFAAPIFCHLTNGFPTPHLLGKIQARACADSRKIPPDQREKRVFVLTKGMSLVGHWPTRLDHIGFAPLRSVWGFARPCLPETGKTNRHKSVQRLRGFLRPRELRVPNQAPALKGMAPSAMVCRARSLTAEE